MKSQHLTRARVRSALSVFVVLVICGLMFTASASLANGSSDRHAENLPELVAQESERVADLQDEVDDLDAEISTLQEEAGVDATDGTSADMRVVSGSIAVEGDGVRVSLNDAPDSALSDDYRPDDLVVHQQDLQGFVNALWAGGAEAMTLQGRRVGPTTAFRCVGNVLILHGRVYSPPYVVEAIGDPDALRAGMDDSDAVEIYRSWVDVVGLGLDISDETGLEMPRTESVELSYARLPDDQLDEVAS
ncbi:Uncharacterized conserved protein YlxW, UPF0749 family [Paraoerskovia marina]|uniref:Uncharacterized conserved protein YlxW, UPF0749 family n=2 Tax=Paraoerskovia marina TaxID=545619 RepID=A0A1H1N799_9CELL|nr:DUF881 domain-containing protein [Paraoerskovia marina]SDR94866.1 Uncharacterized conserved protein YlxW, UPF0749 family [Paraoerskovia marina]